RRGCSILKSVMLRTTLFVRQRGHRRDANGSNCSYVARLLLCSSRLPDTTNERLQKSRSTSVNTWCVTQCVSAKMSGEVAHVRSPTFIMVCDRVARDRSI